MTFTLVLQSNSSFVLLWQLKLWQECTVYRLHNLENLSFILFVWFHCLVLLVVH